MSKHQMITVNNWDDIPNFSSEAEEAVFWGTHDLSEKLLEKMAPMPEGELPASRPKTRPLPVRFDEMTISRLKNLAAKRHTGYHTLLKQFVIERLYEEEKREA